MFQSVFFFQLKEVTYSLCVSSPHLLINRMILAYTSHYEGWYVGKTRKHLYST